MPALRLPDGRLWYSRPRLAAISPVMLSIVLVVDGDVPTWGRLAAVPMLAAGAWMMVAMWRQHVTLHTDGLTTRRVVWRETTPWSDISTIRLRYIRSADGTGWVYSAVLHDGRVVPRETFGELLLREADRDRLIEWVAQHVSHVRVVCSVSRAAPGTAPGSADG